MNSSGFHPTCWISFSKTLALAAVVIGCFSVAWAQTARFDGQWTNRTFGSTGKATFTGAVQGEQLTFTFDLDGNVFGVGNPDSVTLTGTFGPGSVVFAANNHPFYGNIRIEFGFDGSMLISFRSVPGPSIDRLEASGTIGVDATNFKANFTVFFEAGSTAVGDIEATQSSGPKAQRLFFAQVGNGGGFKSDLVFPNPTTKTVTGAVSFGDDNGSAISLDSGGVTAQSVPPGETVLFQLGSAVKFSIPPLGVVTLSTSGQGDVKVGSAAVLSDEHIGGVIRFTIPNVGIAGVGESPPLKGFIIPVRRTAGDINTGIAIRNISNKAVNIELSLRSGDREVASTRLDNFPAHGHLARFINELFRAVNTDNFVGTLVVRVSDGELAGTALELGPKPGQFTTLPVIPLR